MAMHVELHLRRIAEERTAAKKRIGNAKVADAAARRAAKARALKASDPTLTHASIAESLRVHEDSIGRLLRRK
jgi:hypothetical protein